MIYHKYKRLSLRVLANIIQVNFLKNILSRHIIGVQRKSILKEERFGDR